MPNVIRFNRWSLLVAMMITVSLIQVADLHISVRAETFGTIFFPILAIALGLYFQRRGHIIGFARTIRGLESLGLMTAACLIFGVSTYPILSFTSGWSDTYLIRADAMLGFNWIQLLRTVQTHPLLCSMIEFAYGSILFQSTLIIVCLSILGRFDHAHRFVAATIVALFFTVFLVYFVPAKSAAIEFLGEGSPGLTFSSSAHVPIINSLRNGSHPPIDLNNIVGLITFPSFHASASLLYAWAAAPIRWLRIPMIILNALMLFSSLILGGHYFVDVIGGSLIALVAIRLAQLMPYKAPTKCLAPMNEHSLFESDFLPLNVR